MMDTLVKLQEWYAQQCDGDWEHDAGITIDTLDNPGWSVTINLRDTILESREFIEITQLDSEHDWIKCWLEEGSFRGVGDPAKLQRILDTFISWATSFV